MRFEDVTERLSTTVRYPGNRNDGKPMNVAIPHLQEVRIWQAVHGGYSWSIMYEPGVPGWPDEEKKKWIGYSCSYRKIAGPQNSSHTIRIDGVFDTFAKAEDACKRQWQQIRRLS